MCALLCTVYWQSIQVIKTDENSSVQSVGKLENFAGTLQNAQSIFKTISGILAHR